MCRAVQGLKEHGCAASVDWTEQTTMAYNDQYILFHLYGSLLVSSDNNNLKCQRSNIQAAICPT